MSKVKAIDEMQPEKIETEEDFNKFLEPFVLARDQARQRIVNLRVGLGEYHKKLDIAEKKFTTLLRSSEDVMAEGEGTFDPNVILNAKRERDGFQDLIAQTENDSMIEARAALAQAEADLKTQFLLGNDFFRKSVQEKLQQKYSEIEAIWSPHIEAVEKIRRELGLHFASYEVSGLFARPPVKLGQMLQILVRNVL